MVDGTLGLDLGDGIGIGSRLVVLDVKGDVSVGAISHRLENPALTVLELERELSFLEGSTFKHFLCLYRRFAFKGRVIHPNLCI